MYAPPSPNSQHKDWYQSVYPYLYGHGLWLRGGEINTLPEAEYAARPFRVLFTRLSTYFDTGYSFTHQILYQIAASTQGVFPDLAYLPPKGDLPYFKQGNVPWLLGTQTKRGPESFDVIGFSNSIVQELINLPSMLSQSGIPLSKSERMKDATMPLLILGGANALYSSCIWGTEPLVDGVWGTEPLVDGVFVGENDQSIRELLEICRDGKAAGKSKPEVLADLEARIPGFFQPENPRSTKKSFIPNLNQSEALEKGPVYYLDDQAGNSHLQISEGCPCFCSFCAESWDRKPYRERSSQSLDQVALRAKAAMGLDTIDIYSFNFNMHSGLYDILWNLVPHFRMIGLKSQRFDLLAHDPEMVEFQHAIQKASLTCGLEGISPRLRKYLHKNLENEQLHKSLSAIFKSRTRELKMFLIATGLEEEQDFTALEDFISHLKAIRAQHHSETRILFSMTPLVRFPWTPLEFENAPSLETYEKIISKTAAKVRAAGFEFRESADLPEYGVSQILVRASDARIPQALIAATKESGYVYYRDLPLSFLKTLEKHLIALGVDMKSTFAGFDLETSKTKPWAKIDTGVKREFLWEEVQRARLYKEIDYCLGRTWTEAKCFHCGGCPTRFHVRDIVLSQQKRKYTLLQFKERIKKARENECEIKVAIEWGAKSVGVPAKLRAVALARALMLANPELSPFYRGAQLEGAAYTLDSGFAVQTLLFDKDGIPELLRTGLDPKKVELIQEHLKEWGTWIGFEQNKAQSVRYEISSPYKVKLDAFLKSEYGLKFTLKKEADRAYNYEFTKESLKKGHIASLVVHYDSSFTSNKIDLVPGPKFILETFLKNAYALNKEADWVRIKVHAFNQEIINAERVCVHSLQKEATSLSS